MVDQQAGDVAVGHVLHQLLTFLDGVGAGGQQRLHPGADGGVELIGRHHLVHEADAPRLGRAEAFGGEEVAVRRARPHGADDVGADGGGDQAQLDFAEAVVCRIDAHRHVAAGHQAHAAGVHVALHAGNRRLGAFVDRAQHEGEFLGVLLVLLARVVGHAAHPVQVGPGAEGRAFGHQHDGAHLRVVAQLNEGLRQFGDHLVVEGVAHVGARQHDGGDAALGGDANGLGHGLVDSSCSM